VVASIQRLYGCPIWPATSQEGLRTAAGAYFRLFERTHTDEFAGIGLDIVRNLNVAELAQKKPESWVRIVAKDAKERRR